MSSFQDISEAQSKLIFSNIQHTEKNIVLITESFEKMLKKENKICNKYDEIANKFKYISDNETFNESFAKMFENISNKMVHLTDIKATKIERIEEKLLPNLMQWEIICKQTRDEAKNLIALRDFELNKRCRIANNNKIKKNVMSENELIMSNIQLSKVLKELLSMTEKFEDQKFDDFKQFLLNYIMIELKYFASGIEILTSAYLNISNIELRSEVCYEIFYHLPMHFSAEMKSYNKQFKKHIERDSLKGYKIPFIRALSRFSHSTTNVDMIGKDENLLKKRNTSKSQSTMSLNSLESKKPENNRKDFHTDLSILEKVSTSDDDTDIDESSDMEPTDTENVKTKPQN